MFDDTTGEPATPHYYGDVVRLLFLAAALFMAIGLPAISNYLKTPTWLSIVSILVIGVAAGLTNPKLLWSAAVNVALSGIGLVLFETYAVMAYRQRGTGDKFFWSNLFLGLIFLFAVYFSVKTLRGLMLKNKNGRP